MNIKPLKKQFSEGSFTNAEAKDFLRKKIKSIFQWIFIWIQQIKVWKTLKPKPGMEDYKFSDDQEWFIYLLLILRNIIVVYWPWLNREQKWSLTLIWWCSLEVCVNGREEKYSIVISAVLYLLYHFLYRSWLPTACDQHVTHPTTPLTSP